MTLFHKTYDSTESVRFGEVIRKRRHEMGMNQTEFGEIVDAKQGTVSQWELGATSPPFETAEYILKVLGFEILIRDTENE